MLEILHFFYFPKTTSEVSDLRGIINYATYATYVHKARSLQLSTESLQKAY